MPHLNTAIGSQICGAAKSDELRIHLEPLTIRWQQIMNRKQIPWRTTEQLNVAEFAYLSRRETTIDKSMKTLTKSYRL